MSAAKKPAKPRRLPPPKPGKPRPATLPKPASKRPRKAKVEPDDAPAHDYAANEAAGQVPLIPELAAEQQQPEPSPSGWPSTAELDAELGPARPELGWQPEPEQASAAELALAGLVASGAVVFEGGRYFGREHAPSPSSRATRSRAGAYAVRTALELTQEEFARLLSVTPRTITRWETGGGDANGPMAWMVATLDELARCHDGRELARGLLHSGSPVTAWLVVLERVSREQHGVTWGMK